MTTSTVLCGIDIGSTNLKVLLIDDQARTLWCRSIPVPRTDDEGAPATDAQALIRTLEALIVEGWRATGSAAPIAAIASTGVGEDGLPADARLEPLDIAIPWFDRRAEAVARDLRPRLDQPVRAGVPIDGTRTAAKWLWLRQHRPQVLRHAAAWIALTDYPTAWWSRTPFISEILAARTGCYDVFSRSWLAGHLEAAGAPALPPVLRAGAVVGTMAPGALVGSGAASASTLLVAGGHDHPVAASVVRRMDPAATVDSLGTANLVYGETDSTVPRSDPYLAFSVPARGNPGVACLGVFEFSASLQALHARDGGASLREFLAADEAQGQPSDEQQILVALRSTLGADGPREQSPTANDPRTPLEAAGFYARRMLAAVHAAGAAGQRTYCVGGWARSRALLRLRASVLGQPLWTVEEEELTALGAALIARDAALPEATFTLKRESRVIDPNPIWQSRYEQTYLKVQDALRTWKEN